MIILLLFIYLFIYSIIKECNRYFQIDDNLTLNILGIILLILIGFMFLVFIEIIEVNIFKISYNTKNNIHIRSRNDYLLNINNIIPQGEEIKEEEKSDYSI